MSSLVLPPIQNDGSKAVADKIDMLLRVIPPGVVANQFLVAVIAEANGLSKPCTPKSVLMAAYNCAMVGLIPGAALGHCYFVPFKGQCSLVIGYKGFLDLAFGCDFLRDVHAEVVLAGEKFRQWNDAAGPQIEHEIPLDRELIRANVVGSYCIYHTVNGGHGIATVNRKQLDAIDTGQNVWRSNYVEMAKKTPIRRAAKEWRITHRLGLALRLDEQAERGEEQTAEIDTSMVPDKAFSLADVE